MPDQDQSNPPPPITPIEKEVQEIMRATLHMLKTAKSFLEAAHYKLGEDPPDAEQMGEGEIPESLAFSLKGSLECALSDHLRPLMKVLRKAIKETPQSLRADFARRQRKAGKGRVH